MKNLIFFFMLAQVYAFSGYNLKTNRIDEFNEFPAVVVFLSSECPCSQSYVSEVIKLSQDFPKYHFVGVISSKEVSRINAMGYFGKTAFPFPVYHDQDLKIANSLNALRTPHAFILLDKSQKVYYSGAVGNRSNAKEATQFYLRDALGDLDAGRKIKNAETKTLGCVIAR